MGSRVGSLLRLIVCSMLLLSVTATAWSYDRVEAVGDGALGLLAVAAGGIPLYLDDRDGLLQLVKSASLDVAVTMALKYAVHERRPDDSDDHSFPSAHSSLAFTSAEYLRKRYGWEYGIPAYGLASFVAWSRVEADKHYVHDVLAGAAIGIASSYFFTTPNLKVNLSAEAAPGYYGVRLSRSW